MALFDTNAEEVAKEMRDSAKKHLESLIRHANSTMKALKEHKSGAFSVGWCENMSIALSAFENDIARSNGAVLVRVKKEKSDRCQCGYC